MKKTICLILIIYSYCEFSNAQELRVRAIKIGPVSRVDTLSPVLDKANNITYKSIKLGDQEWIISSIKNKKYNDGTKIPYLMGDIEWNATDAGAYRIVKSTLKNSYGFIYNVYAVETNMLCPIGWRVGNISDYRELANYLKNDSISYVRYSHIVDTNKYSTTEARQVRCIKEK